MKHRMFFAVNLSERCRSRIFSLMNEFKNYSEPIKWESFEKLHITTLFLGDIDTSVIPILVQSVKMKLEVIGNTEIYFQSLGAFPNFKNPRVIWIGIKENLAIERIGLELASCASQIGIEVEERNFHPHVTIGRVKGRISPAFIDKLRDYSFESFIERINSVELMKSELDRFGSKYYIHKKFNLREN